MKRETRAPCRGRNHLFVRSLALAPWCTRTRRRERRGDRRSLACSSMTPQPHPRSRRDVLRAHPEIRSLFGNDPRTASITYAVVAGQLAIAWTFQRLADAGSRWSAWWVIAVTAYAIGAFAAKWSGVAVHESSHNLVYRTTRQNLLFAIIANIPVLVPSAATFRRHHLAHHSFMGITGRDNDLPTAAEVDVVGRSPMRKLVWLFFYVFFGTLGRGFVRRPTRWEILNIAVQVAANIAIVQLAGWTAVAYLALSVFFGFGLHPVAGHFIHEHYLWDDQQGDLFVLRPAQQADAESWLSRRASRFSDDTFGPPPRASCDRE